MNTVAVLSVLSNVSILRAILLKTYARHALCLYDGGGHEIRFIAGLPELSEV